MIGEDHTNSDLKSMVRCTLGSLGFVFVNVTSLKLTNLRFAFCWHSFLYSEGVFLYTCDYKGRVYIRVKQICIKAMLELV